MTRGLNTTDTRRSVWRRHSITAALRISRAFGAMLLVGVVAAQPALGAATLDQSATFRSGVDNQGFFSGKSMAQIFTPAASGSLTKVGLGINQNGSVTNLTVAIYAASAGVPTGSSLATTTLTGAGLGVVTAGKTVFDVEFLTPASVVAESTYALVVTTTDSVSGNPWGYYGWYYSTDYARGNAAVKTGASWSTETYDLTFATYVDSSGDSPSGGAGEAASVPTRTLQFQGDSRCATQEASSLDGQWLQLPSAADCTRAGHTLLGWSTSAAFPVAVAKAQVDKGWGAIDDTFDGVRMIFIPAGGYTLLSGDNNLYEVWGPA